MLPHVQREFANNRDDLHSSGEIKAQNIARYHYTTYRHLGLHMPCVVLLGRPKDEKKVIHILLNC